MQTYLKNHIKKSLEFQCHRLSSKSQDINENNFRKIIQFNNKKIGELQISPDKEDD